MHFFANEKNRLIVIERQRCIENDMKRGDEAVFFVPSMLTPLFINPDDIEFDPQDNLFKLKPGKTLPKGLIPADKASNPAELSAVLGRAVSIQKMLKSGVKITVLIEKQDRSQVGNATENVDDTQIKLIQEKYPNFRVYVLPEGVYEENKNGICAATYFKENRIVGIRASQIHKPNMPTTEVVENPNTAPLNELLTNILPHSSSCKTA